MSILQYKCITWMPTKRIEKKLDENWTKMPRAIMNKSWMQHTMKQQLYGHLPPFFETVPVRRTRLAEHCKRSKNEPLSDVLPWTPTHGRASIDRPARTYVKQLCAETGCSLKTYRERWMIKAWRERERERVSETLQAAWPNDDDIYIYI